MSDTFYREPVNAVTSFVDASNVYGSDDRSAAALRAGKGGLLVNKCNNVLKNLYLLLYTYY